MFFKKLHIYLVNTPGILTGYGIWKWHNLSLCLFVQLLFKFMMFPLLVFWIKKKREGAGCACKPVSSPRRPGICAVPVGALIKDLIKQASLTSRLLCCCLGVVSFPLSLFYYFFGTSSIVLKIIWDEDRMMHDVRKLEPNVFIELADVPHISTADRLIWKAHLSRS